jgi:hypothetical protein
VALGGFREFVTVGTAPEREDLRGKARAISLVNRNAPLIVG